MNEDSLDKPIHWEHRSASQATVKPAASVPSGRLVIVVIGAMILGILAFLGFPHGSATPPVRATPTGTASASTVTAVNPIVPAAILASMTVPTPTSAAANTPVPTATMPPATAGIPTATPDHAAQWVASITGLENATAWDLAAEKAEAALQDPSLTLAQAAEIAHHAVTDWLNVLANEPFQPMNRAAAEADVRLFTHLDDLAKTYGIRLRSYHESEDAAFQHQQYLLAKYLWERALTTDQISRTDPQELRRYYAILYGVGFWFTQDPKNDDLMREGARYLVAADRVSVAYGFDTAAWGRLRELYGSDEQVWTKDTVPTPLLNTTKGA